jgi:hypothetical protein
VVLRCSSAYTATFSAGVTSALFSNTGGYKIYRATAGSGTVTFS